VPGAAVVGRVESDDEGRVRAGDRAGPLLCSLDEVAGDAGGRVEGAAVEAGEEGLGDVARGSDHGGRGRHLDEAGALAADGVDHAGEGGAGDGAGVDVGLERGDGAGHGAGDVVEAGAVDQGRRPSH
jgi:hypothetical protein